MKFSDNIMNLLVSEAKKAFDEREVPVSAIIFDDNFNVISFAHNNRQRESNLLGHAEILAILDAEKKIGDWRLDGYKMVVNLKPCNMCSAIIAESRLDSVYFFVNSGLNGDFFDIDCCCVDGYDDQKLFFKELLTDFFDNMR